MDVVDASSLCGIHAAGVAEKRKNRLSAAGAGIAGARERENALSGFVLLRERAAGEPRSGKTASRPREPASRAPESAKMRSQDLFCCGREPQESREAEKPPLGRGSPHRRRPRARKCDSDRNSLRGERHAEILTCCVQLPARGVLSHDSGQPHAS
ncbi:hypothetical protein [Paenibacillus hamazuiensis]|uniref:hypothetical protein n=1 Tax=Paenibacillus hamazuiensis TaxID=2936508 RepID=UPI002010204C|nr:hypothetical protein [Paenibacillus hamazuiensis]